MDASPAAAKTTPTSIKVKPIDATPESFAPFGQVVSAAPDGQLFGPHDAQLDLSRGIPRFYIMSLENRPLKFSKITHHASVTQCLGSVGGEEWYLGVAKPSILDGNQNTNFGDNASVHSHCGHYYIPPNANDVSVFRIVGPKFLKLNVGTWHAGPLFKKKSMDFYNLELSNTNEVDHTPHDFLKKDGVQFVIED